MTEVELVSATDLHNLLKHIYLRYGMSAEDATRVADVLVWAELQGRGGHGAVRTTRYVEMIRLGELDPLAVPETIVETPATLLVDAHGAAGPVAMTFGTDCAIARAAGQGGCFALVRHTTHTGALGFYVKRAAEAGFVALAFAAGKPLMAYHGAAVASASTSPIAIAIPSGQYGPMVLDMATSVASLGKLKQLAAMDAPLPDDWALTADGLPANRAVDAAIPLPLGGAKGSGLSLMFEAMTGVLGGWPVLAPSLGTTAQTGLGQNAMIMTLNPEAFGYRAAFLAAVDALIDKIRALPPRAGFAGVSLPGDRSTATERARLAAGIPLPAQLLRDLKALAADSA